MLLGRTNIISTSQDAPLHAFGQTGITNSAGSGAGASVTIAVTFAASSAFPAGYPTPNYVPLVTPSQGCLVSVPPASKTQLGFNVILTPVPAASTLAAGSFDVMVIA
jgi:hypothetical protein